MNALNSCDQSISPNIFALLSVYATLPVSMCESERIFHKVVRILSAIRTTMGEDNYLPTHRDELPSRNDVIERFINKK